ncbi:MAG: hypothetical protein ACTSWY_10675 [Promethearchaeota archaeon]
MPNITREELVGTNATMNQLRNMIYHLIKFMDKKIGIEKKELIYRLRRMGKNIAKTEATLFKFEEKTPKMIIKTIYRNILGSKVFVSNNFGSDLFTVEDKNCCVCKYHREDISVSPCELINSMVSELLVESGLKVINSAVKQSVALGAQSCIHSYQIQPKEGEK